MNEEIMSIRGWVANVLNAAVEEGNKKRKVSDYDRGRISGIISAYQHVLVETSPPAAWKIEYNVFEGWVGDITACTPLTIGEAIEIYDFCDMRNLLLVHDLVGTVIRLNAMGFTKDGIKDAIQKEAIIQSIFKKYENMRNEDEKSG